MEVECVKVPRHHQPPSESWAPAGHRGTTPNRDMWAVWRAKMGTLLGDSQYRWCQTCLHQGYKYCHFPPETPSSSIKIRKYHLEIVKQLPIVTKVMKMDILKKIFQIVLDHRLLSNERDIFYLYHFLQWMFDFKFSVCLLCLSSPHHAEYYLHEAKRMKHRADAMVSSWTFVQ